MNEFSINTRMTKKEYAKVVLIGLYKKVGFIISTIVGLYLLITVILDYSKVINYYSDTPYYEFFCGLFILIAPLLITIISVGQFNSNLSFQNSIKYTFSDMGMTVEGTTFKGEFLWEHIIKLKEVSNFLILYHTKTTGNFIDKSKLTKEQLQFIRTKVGEQ